MAGFACTLVFLRTHVIATNQTNLEQMKPVVGRDGREVVFISDSETLVPEETHGIHQVYVYDTRTRPTMTC